MDRLTTGRRHARAGSVTVTELLIRQASPARCTDSSPAEPDDITDIIPVVAPASHRRQPARGAHFAKLASIGVAGAVLCGAVAVSSMISHQRRDNTQSATRPTVQITGDQALLPDRLDKTLPEAPVAVPAPPPILPPTAEADRTPSASVPPAAPAPATEPAKPVEPVDGTSASSGTSQTTPEPANDLDLVRAFYANLPDAPTAAFELLSPELLHSDLGEFLQSWSRVVEIELVDVAQRADGVVATVRMRLLTGGHLRIQQLLTVAESPRRIVGVQLLSAQRN